MKRFMIGQYGSFDTEKQARDFRKGFFGVEACMLAGKQCIDKLMNSARDGSFKICVHFPLRAGGWRLRDPQFLSLDEEVSRNSYEYMEREFDFLRDIKPHYILLHYPKPVILNESGNWSDWRFADDTEYYFEKNYSFGLFSEKSEELFEWLSDIGMKNGFIPVLEFDALNRYVYGTDFLEKLLDKYNRIRICLDIGRLHLQDKSDHNFDSFATVRKFARYAEVVHLWNVKANTNLKHSHFPALPGLPPEEGWADIERYLKTISEENKSFKIMFEHRSDLITDEELENCYGWINGILSE